MYSPCRIHPRRLELCAGTFRIVRSAPRGVPVSVGSPALQEGLADLQSGRTAQIELVLEMTQVRHVVVPPGAEIERVLVAGVDRLIDAAGQLGVPRQGSEPRGLDPRVLEPLFTD